MTFSYTELLEPVPPWGHNHIGQMALIDSTHIVVIGCSKASYYNPSSAPLRSISIMDTSTEQATLYNSPFGWLSAENSRGNYAGRYWLITTSHDVGGVITSVHAVEADGGVYTWNTGISGDLSSVSLRPGSIQMNNQFWYRASGGRTRSYSMETPTLGNILFDRSDLPINTNTGTAIPAGSWYVTDFGLPVGGTQYAFTAPNMYGFDYQLWTFDLANWTLTPVTVNSAAAAVCAMPRIFVNNKYWSHGTWFSLDTMTGGTVAPSGIGPHALAGDGHIYYVNSDSSLRTVDPISGTTNTQAIPNRGGRYGLAYSNGYLWCPSEQPYS